MILENNYNLTLTQLIFIAASFLGVLYTYLPNLWMHGALQVAYFEVQMN